MKNRIIIIGPPGVGKGTIGHKLAEELEVPYVSTGDMLRHYAQQKTELGRKVNGILATGVLVPEEITNELVSHRLSQDDCANGFVLDGFPRNKIQLLAFEKFARIDVALFLDAPEELLLQRIGGRLTCSKCGEIYHRENLRPDKEGLCNKDGGKLLFRSDQSPEVIRVRIETYERETKPIIDYYKKQGLLEEIDASFPLAQLDRIMQQVNKALRR